MKTKYFVNCRCVFQGGGCRAVGFIGAYRRAKESGIGFSEFAGTSAGSIIAALAAAGATAEEMENFLFSLDLKQFEGIEGYSKLQAGYLTAGIVVKNLFSSKDDKIEDPWMNTKRLSAISNNCGLHSSEYIQDEVESFLKAKLGKKTEVRFSDLKYPLKIVAADIVNKSVHIFGNSEDDSRSVAYAVRCSCSFPFFFFPVDDTFIDGGVLCNLPIIIFPNRGGSTDRTLAFTLKDVTASEKKGFRGYAKKVVDTLTEGASKLQMQERQKVTTIEVPAILGLFEFNEVKRESERYKQAIESGEEAVDQFLMSENRAFAECVKETADSFTNAEQIYNQVIYYSSRSCQEIVISSRELKWVWYLTLVLIWWCKSKKKVTVFTEARPGNSEEDSRMRLLQHLGVTVVPSLKNLPVYGFYFSGRNRWKGIAIRRTLSGSIIGRLLDSRVDSDVVSALVELLMQRSNASKPLPIKSVDAILEPANINNIAHKIDVDMYKGKVKNIQTIALGDLIFANRQVHGYKYRMMQYLYSLYKDSNLELYEAAQFKFTNGNISQMCPVIVEEINNKYHVIEGHARLLYCYRNSIDTIQMLVIKNVNRKDGNINQFVYTIDDLYVDDKDFEVATQISNGTQKSRKLEKLIRPCKKYLL